MSKKYVYFFSKENTEGRKELKDLLGGKGANLAEMCSLGLPIPPGFTITTEVCDLFYKNNFEYPQVKDRIHHARHGHGSTGTNRNEQRILFIP